MTVADECVKRSRSLAGSWISHEQPIFLAYGAGADRVFNQVVVDLNPAVIHEHEQLLPLVEGVADGFPGETCRAMFGTALELSEAVFDPLEDRDAVLLSRLPSLHGSGASVAQAGFDAVELLDLREDPLGVFAFGLRFKKLPPHMREAAGEDDESWIGPPLHPREVGGVVVTLDDAGPSRWYDVVEAGSAASGVPLKVTEVAHGVVNDPEVTGATAALAFSEQDSR